MSEDEVWQERYSKIISFPYSWVHKATDLLYCASLILRKSTSIPLEGTYENLGVFMMLHSFAFENMFKGLILLKKKEKSPNLEWLFSTHDLLQLSKESGFICTEEEKRLFRRLKIFCTGGRYPVPNTWKKYKVLLDGSGEGSVVIIPKDIKTMISLIHRIEAEFKANGINCDLYDRGYEYEGVYIRRQITYQV